jgi:hypothetical protein
VTDENLDPDREVQDPAVEEEKVDNASVEESVDATPEEDVPVDQRKEYVHDPEVHGRDYRVEGNDVRDYIGVDPEYMTYANETDAPILTDTERFNYTDQYDHLEGNADEVTDEEISVKTYELSDSQRAILREAGDPVEDDVVVKEESEKLEGASEAPLYPTL